MKNKIKTTQYPVTQRQLPLRFSYFLNLSPHGGGSWIMLQALLGYAHTHITNLYILLGYVLFGYIVTCIYHVIHTYIIETHVIHKYLNCSSCCHNSSIKTRWLRMSLIVAHASATTLVFADPGWAPLSKSNFRYRTNWAWRPTLGWAPVYSPCVFPGAKAEGTAVEQRSSSLGAAKARTDRPQCTSAF